ncbi:MAG: DNA-processing protein DprA, partial [Clostridia bacterium]|nr:DNA-processing protein DprA [Clostridia bacterium]
MGVSEVMIYWIWLQSAVGYGYKHTSALLERYETAEKIYHTPISDLEFSGLFSKSALSKLKNKDLDAARKVLNECIKRKVNIITLADDKYPPLLCEIPNPPIVLYAKGNLELLDCRPGVCIVGPREVSDFGKKAAFSLGARLAAGGLTIVSGGAKGCDTAAHKGALAVGGNTVCVLAVGIEDDYLQLNKELREQIAKVGLLVSEFQPGSSVRKGTFSIRNRLMSGLTLGTVVIEVDETSGALITANHAAEQNRDVFVIPGNPTLPYYKGSNLLLRDGAKALL